MGQKRTTNKTIGIDLNIRTNVGTRETTDKTVGIDLTIINMSKNNTNFVLQL